MVDYTSQFILLCFAVFILYWIVMAFRAKRTLVGASRRQEWRLFLLIAAAIGVYAFRNRLAGQLGAALWPHSVAVGLVADCVAFAGLVMLLWARTVLAGNWSSAPVIKENHEIVERGPYALIRHPIYGGVLLMILSAAINTGRLAWFLVFLLCLFGLYFKARREEELLAQHFPEQYAAYRARVKALIPYVL